MAQRSRSFQPTAWQAKSTSHVFKPVIPQPHHGMHVNLHKHLSERYQRSDTLAPAHNYSAVIGTIYKQRPAQRVFAGAGPNQSYPVHSMVRRLSLFDPHRGPPSSKQHPTPEAASLFPYVVCSKPVYSGDEVRRIVNRLHQRKQDEGRCPPPEMPPLQRRRSYPAALVEQVLDRFQSEEKLCASRPSRGRSVIAAEVTSASRKLSKPEVDFLCSRLNEYNPQKWPPNSKELPGSEPSPRVRVKYPAHAAPNQRYIDDIVERLHHVKSRHGKTRQQPVQQEKQQPMNKTSDVTHKRVVFANDDDVTTHEKEHALSPRVDVNTATPLQSARSEEVETEGEDEQDPVLREMMQGSSKQDGGSRMATPRTIAEE